MISLPNNCRCSELAVYPKNWKSQRAKTSLNWYISYRFYQPGSKAKQVILKKMNEFKQEALAILHGFPPSPVRDGFEELVNFVTDRKYFPLIVEEEIEYHVVDDFGTLQCERIQIGKGRRH